MKPKPINRRHQRQLQILGSFFRELRLNEGQTQHELSKYLNVHLRTIQRLESGKNITLLTLFELADGLDLNIIKELFEDSK